MAFPFEEKHLLKLKANNVLPPIASDLMSVPDLGYDGTQWRAKLADKPGLNPLTGEFYFL
jgi:hypothetical protein